MIDENSRDTESPSHQRAPFSDPLAGGMDPTAPGAPHEPGGEATRQSEAPAHDAARSDLSDLEELHRERDARKGRPADEPGRQPDRI